jgi:Purple acid Phosphatase, N-terminal domain/Calcineurin-like phosphoesterase
MSLAEQHEWFRRATSRRALLRGTAVGAGAALAAPALLAGTAGASATRSAKATPALITKGDWAPGSYQPPFGRHIAFGADPSSQMSVAWQTAGPVSNPFIRVGHDPFNLGHRVSAELRNLATPASVWNSSTADPVDSTPPSLSAATIEQYYLHAQLSGLRPGQTYYYSVGHDGWDRGEVSGHFTTAPRGRHPFTFTAFGDQGVTYDAIGNTNLIRAQDPAFHLHAGDISYAESGGSGLINDPYDPRVWDSWFTEVENAAGVIPWNAVVGNHEMEAWYSPDGYGGQFARFDFPGGPSQTYYSFKYGNVGLVALDANDVSYELPANFGYSGGAQVSWLNSTLAGFRADPEIDFIVVYFHHCAYCTCTTHGCDGGVEKYFVPAFDTYSVDLVINGHNHIYERTYPVKGGSTVTTNVPVGATWPSANGTTYITAGGAGKSLYSFSAEDYYEGDEPSGAPTSVSTYINEYDPTTQVTSTTNETVTWSAIRYTGYCLLVIDSEPGHWGTKSKLKIRGLDEAGGLLDAIELVR